MSQRVLIQLSEEEGASCSLPDPVMNVLESAGATNVRASHPELPGLFTAILPEDADAENVLQKLRASRSVRHAELDSFAQSC